MGADGLADVGPDGQQDALALVVAGAVGVGLAEVAGGDGAVDGGDDLGQARSPRAGGPARSRRPTPRLERTRPAPFRARRICSR